MSLNDPFGRVSRRREQAYAEFREQLRAQDVLTVEAVRTTQARLSRTSLSLAAIVLGAVVLGGLLFSALRPMLLVLGGLLLVWLGSSFVLTRAQLSRYRMELAAGQASRKTTNPEEIPEENQNDHKP